MGMISSIWHTAAYVLGAIFLITGILSLILYGMELLRLRRAGTHTKTNTPTKTGTPAETKTAAQNEPAERSAETETVNARSSRTAFTRRRAALITGASSGLGAGFVREIDSDPEKYGVTEIWLLARRKGRLEKLAGQLHLPVHILSMDMTDEEALRQLDEQLRKASETSDFSVSLMINCAGYGKSGYSADVGSRAEAGMVRLNDEAAVNITQLCLPYMQPGARIGEICSVAGFQPIPGINAYAASKAFLYSYSRALRIELLNRGISVTAVCPYWIRDTEFITVATGKPKHPFMSKTTRSVVRRSIRDIRKRRAVSTPGLVTSLDRFFRGLIPDALLARICGLFSLK